jgi:hypothetical protein
MKKLLFAVLFFAASLGAFSQNTIWNHPLYNGNLHGTKTIFDVSSSQTRAVWFDTLESQLVKDSLFASYAFVRKMVDSLVSTSPSGSVPQSRTLTINGTTFDLSANRTWSISAGVSSVFGRVNVVTAQSGDYTAAQVTNAVDQTGSYTNPSWLVSLPWSKITSTPTTISTYGITDAYTKTQSDANYFPLTGGLLSNSSNGWVGLPTLTSSPAPISNVIQIYQDSAHNRAYRYGSGFIREFVGNISANRTVTWFDATDTIANRAWVIALVAGYTPLGSGVDFVYDSSTHQGAGTGASPFSLLTQSKIVPGYYTAPTVHITNKGIIDSILNGTGSVGPFLFLPTQSTFVGNPTGGIYVFDSAGFNWRRPDGLLRTIDWQTISVNRRATFPDTSFTAAGQNIQNSFSVGQIISFSGTNQLMLKNGTGFSVFNQASNGGLSIALSGNNLTVPNTNTSNLTTGTGSTLTLGGALNLKRVGKADVAYTASATADCIIEYTSLTASRAVTAPGSPATGLVLIIKDAAGNAGTFNITFVGTLDGVSNPALVDTNKGCRGIYYNGTNWQTLFKF